MTESKKRSAVEGACVHATTELCEYTPAGR